MHQVEVNLSEQDTLTATHENTLQRTATHLYACNHQVEALQMQLDLAEQDNLTVSKHNKEMLEKHPKEVSALRFVSSYLWNIFCRVCRVSEVHMQ